MPDATGRFRGYPAGRRGAQPGVPRPTSSAAAPLGHFRAFCNEVTIGPGQTWAAWHWNQTLPYFLRRGCSIGTNGAIVPDLGEYPNGSIWQFSITSDLDPGSGEGGHFLEVASLDTNGNPEEVTRSPRIPFSPFVTLGGNTSDGSWGGLVTVMPGGSFIPRVEYIPVGEGVHDTLAIIHIDCHTVDDHSDLVDAGES